MNPNLFIVSGGPGSGKTTVLCELAKLGFPYAPEVARRIIQEQVQVSGTALPWHDREAYTRLMLQHSIESYLEHTPRVETHLLRPRNSGHPVLRSPDWPA